MANILNDETIPELMELITAEEAEAKYDISEYVQYPFLDFADGDDGEFQEIRLFKGDLTVDGIESTMERDWNFYSLIIDGNLTVNGDIDWCETNNGNFIFVTGNVKARNVILKGNPEVVVLGDLEATNSIMGNEGEDGGRLTVIGAVKALVVIEMYYFIMDLENIDAKAFVSFDDGEEAATLLLPEFYDEEDEVFDDAAIEDALRQGRNVLRAGL